MNPLLELRRDKMAWETSRSLGADFLREFEQNLGEEFQRNLRRQTRHEDNPREYRKNFIREFAFDFLRPFLHDFYRELLREAGRRWGIPNLEILITHDSFFHEDDLKGFVLVKRILGRYIAEALEKPDFLPAVLKRITDKEQHAPYQDVIKNIVPRLVENHQQLADSVIRWNFIRTRDPKIVQHPNALVWDVGFQYDGVQYFDHHQEEKEGEKDRRRIIFIDGEKHSIPYAAAGLLFKDKGMPYLDLFYPNKSPAFRKMMHHILERQFIAPLDAWDNGEPKKLFQDFKESDVCGLNRRDFIKKIQCFRPTWAEMSISPHPPLHANTRKPDIDAMEEEDKGFFKSAAVMEAVWDKVCEAAEREVHEFLSKEQKTVSHPMQHTTTSNGILEMARSGISEAYEFLGSVLNGKKVVKKEPSLPSISEPISSQMGEFYRGVRQGTFLLNLKPAFEVLQEMTAKRQAKITEAQLRWEQTESPEHRRKVRKLSDLVADPGWDELLADKDLSFLEKWVVVTENYSYPWRRVVRIHDDHDKYIPDACHGAILLGTDGKRNVIPTSAEDEGSIILPEEWGGLTSEELLQIMRKEGYKGDAKEFFCHKKLFIGSTDSLDAALFMAEQVTKIANRVKPSESYTNGRYKTRSRFVRPDGVQSHLTKHTEQHIK